jgi:hypothetical protein
VVSAQLHTTLSPTDTLALAGMYCSTAICGWAGSLAPAWIVMGPFCTEPAAIESPASSDDPQAAPTTSAAAVTATSVARQRRIATPAIGPSARVRGPVAPRDPQYGKGVPPLGVRDDRGKPVPDRAGPPQPAGLALSPLAGAGPVG